MQRQLTLGERPRLALPLIGVVSVISFVIGGIGSVLAGLLIEPLMSELGWPSRLASSLAACFNLAALASAPVVGVLLDRVAPPRIVMSGGILVASASVALVSHLRSPYMMLAAFSLVGVGYSAAYYVSAAAVVTKTMGNHKSLGMGIVLGATSGGAAAFSTLLSWLIEVHGWRFALNFTGVTLVLTLPFALAVKLERPSPTGEGTGSSVTASNRGARGIRSVFFTRSFAVIAGAGALFNLGMGGIYYHFVSVLIGAGYHSHTAGMLLGLSWLVSTAGSMVLGPLADRSSARAVLAWALVSCSAGTLSLLGAGTGGAGLLCVAGFMALWGGTANSAFQFFPVLLSERFGSERLGTTLGVQSAIAGSVGAVAPVLTGALYDAFGGYSVAIVASALAMLLASGLIGCVWKS